jgi:hypothetical protein
MAQDKWNGLSEVELYKLWSTFVMPEDVNGIYKERFGYERVFFKDISEFAQAIEQALKEKNHA